VHIAEHMAGAKQLKLSLAVDPPVSADPPTIVALIDGNFKPKSHTIKRSFPYAEEFLFTLDSSSHWLELSVFQDSTESKRIGRSQFDVSGMRAGDRVDATVNLTDSGPQRLMVSFECASTDKPVGMFGHLVKAVAQGAHHLTNLQSNTKNGQGLLRPRVRARARVALTPPFAQVHRSRLYICTRGKAHVNANARTTGVQRLVTIDVVAARGLPPRVRLPPLFLPQLLRAAR